LGSWAEASGATPEGETAHGCGAVYLDGYLNIDVREPGTFLAKDRPDLVVKWRTTEDRYYARHEDKTIDTLRDGPLHQEYVQEYVCGRYGDFFDLPAAPGDVSEVLTRQCFEHLSIREAHRALDSLCRLMASGGLLRVDVPDHEETLRLFRQNGDEFYIRHLLGPRRNDYGFHMMSYTRDRLRALVEGHGFSLIAEEPNIHFFPAFCLRFKRA
jgi:hypothetical protein